jgi:hypothetical protein
VLRQSRFICGWGAWREAGRLKNIETFAAFAGSSLRMKSSQKHGEASADRLDSMEVRLIQAQSARLGERHLRYVATVHGYWVALLAFSGAAPHLKAGEQWLGCQRS